MENRGYRLHFLAARLYRTGTTARVGLNRTEFSRISDMAHPATIKSVSDLLAAASAAAASAKRRTHLRLWCRGHSLAGWKLQPGVYRLPSVKDEKARLLRERHLTQDFRLYSAGLRTGGETDED